jgi:O-acetyl-ADP-ribose deacetylase (regulator of RNase III)
MISYIDGDLIKLALHGTFDVVAHGCNCFCTMGAGIAPQMAKAFGCDNFKMEMLSYMECDEEGNEWQEETDNRGNINKLGTIDWQEQYIWFKHPMSKDPVAMGHRTVGQPDTKPIIVVNAYTQYHYGRNHADGVSNPFDYEAFTMCMRKMNRIFTGKHIGMPKIGAGLAGGNWNRIEHIINTELRDCAVTIVNYKPE